MPKRRQTVLYRDIPERGQSETACQTMTHHTTLEVECRELEATLRQQLGTFADTSIDRMAQSVAAEVIQEDISKLTPEDRHDMRENIQQKLRQMLRDKAKEGA